jgi:hypothetical protein
MLWKDCGCRHCLSRNSSPSSKRSYLVSAGIIRQQSHGSCLLLYLSCEFFSRIASCCADLLRLNRGSVISAHKRRNDDLLVVNSMFSSRSSYFILAEDRGSTKRNWRNLWSLEWRCNLMLWDTFTSCTSTTFSSSFKAFASEASRVAKLDWIRSVHVLSPVLTLQTREAGRPGMSPAPTGSFFQSIVWFDWLRDFWMREKRSRRHATPCLYPRLIEKLGWSLQLIVLARFSEANALASL